MIKIRSPRYGISERARRRPFIVKFRVGKRHVYVGSYHTLSAAQAARDQYLRTTK